MITDAQNTFVGDTMNYVIENSEEIFDAIPGFHRYILDEPVHLCFAGSDLCDMTGYTKDELVDEKNDLYALIVHPEDREEYIASLKSISTEKIKLQYRIITKDGTVKHVSDSISVTKTSDGKRVADSVLTDITLLKKENNELKFLNDIVPCGFLKYTCEKQPRVTYINEQMLRILRFPKNTDCDADYLDSFKDNIYQMIPMEDRVRFSKFLDRVYTQDSTAAGEMTVLCHDGTRGRVYGWVTKTVNSEGVEEFQSVCMDITEKHQAKKDAEIKKYLNVLTEVYDKIFEYDFAGHVVKCLYGKKSEVFRWLEGVPMQLEEATEKWIYDAVIDEDKASVKEFFEKYRYKNTNDADGIPPQIKYRALSSSGEIKTYLGTFLKIESSVSLFCCRSVVEDNNSGNALNENMREFVMNFTDGIAAFELVNDCVTPLYMSDNACEFFGFTQEEWLSMMKKNNAIKEFISRGRISYDDVQKLLKTGNSEFTYFDVTAKINRRIKAVCSKKTQDKHEPRYIMLYNVDKADKNTKHEENKPCVYIRTFGYLDVFVDSKPIVFRSKKSKELFALLVDRNGGYVSSEEAIGFLWEDEPVSSLTQTRYRKVALRLKNTLEEYGVGYILESVDGKRRIVTENVRCDLYDYLSGKEEFSKLFNGSYLTNYSWAETTLGYLVGEMMQGE